MLAKAQLYLTENNNSTNNNGYQNEGVLHHS